MMVADRQYLLFIPCSLKDFGSEIIFAKRRDFYILIPSRLHLHIFVVSSAYSSTSIPRRRLDLLLNATWYESL